MLAQGDQTLIRQVFTAAIKFLKKSFLFFALALSSCVQTPPLASLKWAAAHRGDQSTGEENSYTAISSAVRKKFHFIEIDIRSSTDRELFLFHDRRLRESNFVSPKKYLELPISDLNAAEVRSININAKGSKVLFFKEALAIIKGSSSRFLLDMKVETIEQIDLVLVDLKREQAEDYVIFQCGDLQSLRYLRQQHPALATLSRVHNVVELEESLTLHPEIIQMDSSWLTKDLAQKAKSGGAILLVNTLDKKSDVPEQWEELLKMGVDIIHTDHPDQVQAFIAQ